MSATELVLDLGRLGIRLEADGERLRYYPQSTLTPDLLDRLKAHKADLLAALRPTPKSAALSKPPSEAPSKPTKAACRCVSEAWRDVPIHDGQSIRRDCGRCGRFIAFTVWYGKTTGPIVQHAIE